MKNSLLINSLNKIGISMKIVDTTGGRRRAVKLIPRILIAVLRSKDRSIILSLNTKSALALLKLLSRLKLLSKRRVYYLVFGSNLPNEIIKHPRLVSILENLKCVFVETMTAVKKLKDLGLRNVRHMPNFKRYDFVPDLIQKESNQSFRTVFFSRVMREKGVELAIKAVRIIRECRNIDITLDIIGPVSERYQDKFNHAIQSCGEFIKYKGYYQPNSDEVHSVLAEYDLMLFPTYYRTEGIPGAIIDAYISGLPVLASNWDNADDVILEGKTGRVFALGDLEDLICKLLWFVQNPDDMFKMRSFCIEEAKQYHVNNVLPRLLKEVQISNEW